jgi:hypothetical protein
MPFLAFLDSPLYWYISPLFVVLYPFSCICETRRTRMFAMAVCYILRHVLYDYDSRGLSVRCGQALRLSYVYQILSYF